MCTWKPKVLADPRDYTMLRAPRRMASADGAPVENWKEDPPPGATCQLVTHKVSQLIAGLAQSLRRVEYSYVRPTCCHQVTGFSSAERIQTNYFLIPFVRVSQVWLWHFLTPHIVLEIHRDQCQSWFNDLKDWCWLMTKSVPLIPKWELSY